MFQTLQTCQALFDLGVPLGLYIAPWHGSSDPGERLEGIGISPSLPLYPMQTLHRRWPAGLFARWHAPSLRHRHVYVRDPRLALSLADRGVRSDFEVHEVRPMREAGQLPAIAAAHRRGVIRFLLPISRAAAVALREAGCVPDRIEVLRSAVAYEAFAAIPDLLPEAVENPVGIYAGRISRSRGLDVLAHLARTGALRLRLVGEADDPVPSLPGLTHRGFVAPASLPDEYAAVQLALLPYQTGLPHSDVISPLKLFEAMAAGRVVIASDLPAVREVLVDGVNGLLVPADRPEAWVDAVQTVRRNSESAIRLAARAREDAREYSWQERARRMVEWLGLPVTGQPGNRATGQPGL